MGLEEWAGEPKKSRVVIAPSKVNQVCLHPWVLLSISAFSLFPALVQ